MIGNLTVGVDIDCYVKENVVRLATRKDWVPFLDIVQGRDYPLYKWTVRELKPILRRAYALAFARAEMEMDIMACNCWRVSPNALCELCACDDCPARTPLRELPNGGYGRSLPCGIRYASAQCLARLKREYKLAYDRLPKKYKQPKKS